MIEFKLKMFLRGLNYFTITVFYVIMITQKGNDVYEGNQAI